MNVSIPKQVNYNNYAIDLPNIKKISSSTDSQMLYFLTDQIARDSTRK